MARISIIVAFACKKLAASGIIRQRNIGKLSLTNLVLPAGRGVIVAPSHRTAGAGIVDAHRDEGRRYIVDSDELFSAFLELEQTLL